MGHLVQDVPEDHKGVHGGGGVDCGKGCLGIVDEVGEAADEVLFSREALEEDDEVGAHVAAEHGVNVWPSREELPESIHHGFQLAFFSAIQHAGWGKCPTREDEVLTQHSDLGREW
jgi:hypothetical protein